MNDIFYYVGYLYIIFSLLILIATLFERKKTNKEIAEFSSNASKELPKDLREIDKTSIVKTTKHVNRFLLKNKIGLILSLLFLLWIISGWIFSEESKIFSAIFYVSLFCFMIPLFGSIVSVFISKNNIPDAFKNEGSNIAKSNIIYAISIADTVIKISLTAFMLHQHFTIIQ